MRTGVLVRAVCQILLRMLSVRFASSPLALPIHGIGMFAMLYGVNKSWLSQSQSHVLLRVVLRWRYVLRVFVKGVVADVHAA